MLRPSVVSGAIGLLALASFNHPVSARPYPFVLVIPREMQSYFVSMPPPRTVPYELRRHHWSGRGTFRVQVDANGRVIAASVVKSTGHHVVDDGLKRGLLSWRAKAGRKREIDFPITVVPPTRGMPAPGL